MGSSWAECPVHLLCTNRERNCAHVTVDACLPASAVGHLEPASPLADTEQALVSCVCEIKWERNGLLCLELFSHLLRRHDFEQTMNSCARKPVTRHLLSWETPCCRRQGHGDPEGTTRLPTQGTSVAQSVKWPPPDFRWGHNLQTGPRAGGGA